MLGLLNRVILAAIFSTAGIAGVVVVDASSGKVLEAKGAGVAAAAPGSTLKPFTAAALLQAGFPETATIACRRTLRIGSRNLDCSHPQLATPVDLSSALVYSCNHFFARASQRLDPRRFAE